MSNNQLQIVISAKDASKGVLGSVEKNLKSVGETAEKMSTMVNAVAASLVGLGMALGGREIVEANKEYESLQAGLQAVLHSADAAAGGMEALRQFAKETPYELNDAVEAFIALKARGLDPSMEALRAYGDIAATMPGKNIKDFVEAVADAVTGEFERLKEFGIKASKDGDTVKMTFAGHTESIKANADAIEQYLQKLAQSNFGGAMALKMKTLEGGFSNLQDAIKQAYAQIGDGGLNGGLKTVLGTVTDLISRNEELARSIGAGLGDALQGVNRLILFTVENIEGLKAALVGLAAVGAVRALTAIGGAIAALATPAAAVAAVVASVAGALYYYRDASIDSLGPSVELRDVLSGTASFIKDALLVALDMARGAFDVLRTSISDLVGDGVWEALQSAITGIADAAIWMYNQVSRSVASVSSLFRHSVNNDLDNLQADLERIWSTDYYKNHSTALVASIQAASQERIAAEKKAAEEEQKAREEIERKKAEQRKAFEAAMKRDPQELQQSDADKKLHERIGERIKDMQAENSQLTRMLEAYAQGEEAVNRLKVAIAGEKAVLAAGKGVNDQEKESLTQLGEANEKLEQAIKKRQDQQEQEKEDKTRLDSLEREYEIQVRLADAYGRGLEAVEALNKELALEAEIRRETQGMAEASAATAEKTIRMTDAARRANEESKKTLEEAKRLGEEFGSTIMGAFEKIVYEGQSVKDTIRSIIVELGRMTTMSAMKPLQEGLSNWAGNLFNAATTPSSGGGASGGDGGGFGSFLGVIGSFVGGLFGGARAIGGPVADGIPYLVGEHGPELFMPGESGKIVPNYKMGGAFGYEGPAPVVYVNIATPNPQSMKDSMGQISSRLSDAVSTGIRNR